MVPEKAESWGLGVGADPECVHYCLAWWPKKEWDKSIVAGGLWARGVIWCVRSSRWRTHWIIL